MQTFVYIIIAISLIAGGTNTLGFTLQNKQMVVEAGVQKRFYHPYVQSCIRFISNFIILIVYFLEKKYSRLKIKNDDVLLQQNKQLQENKKNSKRTYFLFIIPMLLDQISVVGFYIALNFIDGSVYQILRGGIIIFTYLFSFKFLKARPSKIKLFGCVIVLSGLLIVGVVNFIFSTSTSQEELYTLLGYGLILFSIVIGALKFIYEEHLLTYYKFSPLLIVGMQGFYGIFFACILLPVLSLIPCGLKIDACVILDSGQAVIEDFNVYLREVGDNSLILMSVLIVLFTMAVNNLSGVVIAKYAKSLTRSICDVSRTVIIWIVGLIVTGTLGQDNDIYKWQSLRWQQILGQSIGFSILVLGNLIYYGAFDIKCLSQQNNDNQRSILSQKQQQQNESY